MTDECIYCAVDVSGKIQWVRGSSQKTRYFKTDKYLRKAVIYHNKYHDDKWFVGKFSLKEIARYLPMSNTDITIFGGENYGENS